MMMMMDLGPGEADRAGEGQTEEWMLLIFIVCVSGLS